MTDAGKARQVVEDELVQIIGKWPEHVRAMAYTYLYSLGFRIENAKAVLKKHWGSDK